MTYRAIEAAQAVSPTKTWLPLRRVARIRRMAKGDRRLQLLSLSASQGIAARASDGGRQQPAAENIAAYWEVRPGDLVVNPMWALEGGVATSSVHGAVSPAYRVYAVGPSVHPRFLHYFMRSAPALSQYRLLVRGETTFDRSVSREDMEGIPIPVPSQSYQSAIADYLDRETARTDALIAAKRRMIEMLEAKFAATRDAVTLRGLDPTTGDRPRGFGWELLNLGTLITLQRGLDLPTDVRELGEIPVISSGGVSGYHSSAAMPGPGVVTGRYGTVGEVFYSNGPYWPLNTTLYVADYKGNHPRWVYYLLASLPLDADSSKSAVTGVNRNVLNLLRAPRPPLDEQVRTADRLDSLRSVIDRTSTVLRKQLDLMTQRRQALITAAVTGALEIPGVAVA